MLTGGEYRSNTNTFVGPITNMVLSKLRYTKAFVGVTVSLIIVLQLIH